MSYAAADAREPWRRLRTMFTVIAVFFFLLSLTRYVVTQADTRNGALVLQYGVAHPLFAIYALLYVAAAFVVLIRSYPTRVGASKFRLRYLLLGLLFPTVGILTTNLALPLLFGWSFTGSYGPLFAGFFLLCTWHAFIRHRLLDVTLVIRQSVTWTLALLMSLIPLLIFFWLFWPVFAARFDSLELTIFLVACLALGLLTPIMRDITERALDKYLYRSHTNYQKTLRQASRRLTRVLNLTSLLRFVADTITQATGCSFVLVYLRAEDGLLRCVVSKSSDGSSDAHAGHHLSASLMLSLSSKKEPVSLEDDGESSGGMNCLTVSDYRLSLLLPIVSDDDLIGGIALGTKRSGDPFYPQDVDLLSTLANQAGVAIKNAQLYEQVVLINEYLQNIVGTIDSGVVAVDQEGHITMFNRSAAQLTGRPADELLGRTVGELPAPLAEALQATLADRQPRVFPEVELPRPPAPALPVICSTTALREPAGELLGAVAVFSDLTPLKELETQRRRAERLAYFEALAAGIAHEIKNPLVAIKTFMQLLPRRYQEAAFREKFGRIADREIGRMEHLVERLRSLAKPGSRPHHVLDLRAPITDALELLQPRFDEKRITVSWTPGLAPHSILGDQSELEQLFLNLFINAFEIMEPGGMLTVRLTGPDGRTVVEVEDTGPGIREELLAKIFDPFVTTKTHGSGLGLAICATIADAHHARIRAANKSGGSGAVFTIEFPAEVMAATPLNV